MRTHCFVFVFLSLFLGVTLLPTDQKVLCSVTIFFSCGKLNPGSFSPVLSTTEHSADPQIVSVFRYVVQSDFFLYNVMSLMKNR